MVWIDWISIPGISGGLAHMLDRVSMRRQPPGRVIDPIVQLVKRFRAVYHHRSEQKRDKALYIHTSYLCVFVESDNGKGYTTLHNSHSSQRQQKLKPNQKKRRRRKKRFQLAVCYGARIHTSSGAQSM